MDWKLIFGGKATCEELTELHEKKGVDIIINDGGVSDVVFNGPRKTV